MTDTGDEKFISRRDSVRFEQEKAKKKLQTIIKDINKIGLTSRFNLYSTFYYRLRKINSDKNFNKRKSLFITILIILFGFYTFSVLKSYFYSKKNSKCLIDVPSFVHQTFRPPEDCTICLDVQQVEKVSEIHPSHFESKYAYSGRPVVVTDATIHWTAPRVFSYKFFKSLYEGRDANCQFFPYNTEFENLQQVFNMSDDRASQLSGTKPWYIGWSNCNEEIGSILREHYDNPYFLPETAESEKTDWIFMGSSGYGAHMHVDDVEHPSWQAQLKGEKLWTLEPPRECHYTCDRLTVTVKQGEIIVLDTNRWYHQTKIVSEEMSITIGAEFD